MTKLRPAAARRSQLSGPSTFGSCSTYVTQSPSFRHAGKSLAPTHGKRNPAFRNAYQSASSIPR